MVLVIVLHQLLVGSYEALKMLIPVVADLAGKCPLFPAGQGRVFL